MGGRRRFLGSVGDDLDDRTGLVDPNALSALERRQRAGWTQQPAHGFYFTVVRRLRQYPGRRRECANARMCTSPLERVGVRWRGTARALTAYLPGGRESWRLGSMFPDSHVARRSKSDAMSAAPIRLFCRIVR